MKIQYKIKRLPFLIDGTFIPFYKMEFTTGYPKTIRDVVKNDASLRSGKKLIFRRYFDSYSNTHVFILISNKMLLKNKRFIEDNIIPIVRRLDRKLYFYRGRLIIPDYREESR